MRRLLCILGLTASLHATLAEDSNAFNLHLYYLISQPGSNLTLSPFNISSALFSLYTGSGKKMGKEMASAIGIKETRSDVPGDFKSILKKVTSRSTKETAYQTGSATSLWMPEKALPLSTYIKTVKSAYGAEVVKLHPAQMRHIDPLINEWTRQKTDDKISNAANMAALDPNRHILVTTAGTFKGQWHKQFDNRYTKNQQFYRRVTGDGATLTRMMSDIDRYPYYEDQHLQVLALPLRKHLNQNKCSLVLFLPKSHLTGQPFGAIYSLDWGKDGTFLKVLPKLSKTKMNVTLPIFAFPINTNLTGPLNSLGLDNLFQTTADFSRISTKMKLSVGQFTHSTYFSMNETGLGLESAPGRRSQNRHSSKEAKTFLANRPFFYMVYDFDAQMILMMGEYVDPTLVQAKVPEIKYIPPKTPPKKAPKVQKEKPGGEGIKGFGESD